MEQLHANSVKVQQILDGAGIDSRVRALSKDTRTAQEAADELGCEAGAIANSLVFIAGGAPLLVMTSGAHRVDEAYLAERRGLDGLRRARAEEVRAATGHPIGGVAPIGHPSPLPTLIDETLAAYPEIWMGGGAPNSIFALTYGQLVALTGGVECRVNP